jgi:hypothetical protein
MVEEESPTAKAGLEVGRKVLQSLPDGTDRLREDRHEFNPSTPVGCVT